MITNLDPSAPVPRPPFPAVPGCSFTSWTFPGLKTKHVSLYWTVLDFGFCYLNSLWMAVNFDPSFPFLLQEIKFIVEFIIKMMMKTFTYSSLSNSRHLRTISVLTALWLLNSFVPILKMTDQDSKSDFSEIALLGGSRASASSGTYAVLPASDLTE